MTPGGSTSWRASSSAPGFVGINPNSKIPALVDRSGGEPVRLFESGAMLLYLAEKFGAFLGTSRAETLSWLFWQMGSAPMLGGGFGHFFAYAPCKIEYAIDRYTMEVKRQLSVLDQRLAQSEYIAGDDYSIADIAIFPWYGSVVRGRIYEGADEFLNAGEYGHVKRWADQIVGAAGGEARVERQPHLRSGERAIGRAPFGRGPRRAGALIRLRGQGPGRRRWRRGPAPTYRPACGATRVDGIALRGVPSATGAGREPLRARRQTE